VNSSVRHNINSQLYSQNTIPGVKQLCQSNQIKYIYNKYIYFIQLINNSKEKKEKLFNELM
jgi:hypothetical protein